MKEVWFWQIFISPHMINLANKLAEKGLIVNYVIKNEMREKRKSEGWVVNVNPSIRIIKIENFDFNEFIKTSSDNKIHIVQGLRNNDYIERINDLFLKNKINFWVVLETIDSSGLKGIARSIIYRRILDKYKNISGILTIGHKTDVWFKKIGFDKEKIYPFTYFLDPRIGNQSFMTEKFVFIFVGNLVHRKRPEVIISSLSKIMKSGKSNFELWVVGSGELEGELKKNGENLGLPIKWLGNKGIDIVRDYISSADCLLLPSKFDGWGAVASEAIIEGTPVICSDSCGAAGVVKKSPFGSVFETNNINEFTRNIENHYQRGKVTKRERNNLAEWGESLTSEEGAEYLYNIFYDLNSKAVPPWDFKCINV